VALAAGGVEVGQRSGSGTGPSAAANSIRAPLLSSRRPKNGMEAEFEVEVEDFGLEFTFSGPVKRISGPKLKPKPKLAAPSSFSRVAAAAAAAAAAASNKSSTGSISGGQEAPGFINYMESE